MAPRLPAAQRRRQLLDVALGVFATAGFDGASMADVAAAAGVTKPVLYQHFRSKRELYLQLLDDVGSQLDEAIAKATAEAEGPRQQVEAGFAAYFRFVADHEHAFRLLFGGHRDDEFREAVQRLERRLADAIASLIDADLDPDHRRLLGHGIVGLAEGTVRQALLAGGPLEPDVLARRTAHLAWAGLRAVRRD